MNDYLVRTLCEDLRDNIRRCCSCRTVNWRLMCVSTCTACLLSTSLVVQSLVFFIDEWATYDWELFGCGIIAEDHLDAGLCGLGATVCSLEFILSIFGIGVCVRSCMGNFDLTSCGFYVSFIPALSLFHGILSLICCLITVEFVSDHRQYNYGTSFFHVPFSWNNDHCSICFFSLLVLVCENMWIETGLSTSDRQR